MKPRAAERPQESGGATQQRAEPDLPGKASAAKTRELMLLWAALIGAAVGWFGSQQVGSNLSFGDCVSSGILSVLLISLAGLALAVAGGLLSWRIWRSGREARSFVAGIGLLTAALLSVAILFQILAAFIIPRCFA
jgi:hypothetical protein